jgi:hypothetical protein
MLVDVVDSVEVVGVAIYHCLLLVCTEDTIEPQYGKVRVSRNRARCLDGRPTGKPVRFRCRFVLTPAYEHLLVRLQDYAGDR